MGNLIIGTLISDLIIPGGNIQGEPLPDLSGDDIIDGVGGDNVIAASDGNDSVVGGSGNDLLFGNQGEDTLRGGPGNDTLYGGQGNDVLFGDSGNNYLSGDRGNDTIFGGSGNDFILGGEGDDYLMAGDGDNTIAGGEGNDTIEGGNGSDLLFGNQGNDVIRTGEGNNTVYGGAGDDTIFAGPGNNFLSGDLGADVLVGGEGEDTFAMSRRSADLTSGGVNISDADRIQNFFRGRDQLFLDGLPFADVSIEVEGGNSIIKDTVTNQFLAVVEGVSDLDATDFSSEIADPEPPRTFEFVDENGEPINLYQFDQAEGGSTAGDLVPRSIFVKRSGTTGEDNLLFNKIPATAFEGVDYQSPGSEVELLNGQRLVSFADGQGTAAFDINLINEVLGTDAVEGGDRFFSLQLKKDTVVVDNVNFLIRRQPADAPLGGGFTFTKEDKEIEGGSTDGAAEGVLGVTGNPDFIRFTIFRNNADVEASVDVITSPGTDAATAANAVTDISELGTNPGEGDFKQFTQTVTFGVNELSRSFEVPVSFDDLGSSIMRVALQGDQLGAFPTADVDIF
ncbi:calcium-binding protein [Geitlerinema sp. P-1104]|nr:calcium-binding protein [Geitlerinema sp. P-1104]NMG58814.1 calcium-binding protein [Geitlerinema sp. P-1104]